MSKREADDFTRFRSHPEAILNRMFCDEEGRLRDRWRGSDGTMTAEGRRIVEAEKADMPVKIARWREANRDAERGAA